jgi:hypothetical protein
MRVGIFGSNEWDNYMDLVRTMTIFIQESHDLGHDNVVFIHGGKFGAENMITEYIGKTQKFLKQKGFKIKEDVFRGRSKISDVAMIEAGLDFAIVFSTGDRRTYSSKKLLEAYEVPYRLVESA